MKKLTLFYAAAALSGCTISVSAPPFQSPLDRLEAEAQAAGSVPLALRPPEGQFDDAVAFLRRIGARDLVADAEDGYVLCRLDAHQLVLADVSQHFELILRDFHDDHPVQVAR